MIPALESEHKLLMKIQPSKNIFFMTLTTILLLLPVLLNFLAEKPLLRGEESYYHLAQAETWELSNLHYWPLTQAVKILPEEGLIFIPILLAIGSFFLFYDLVQKTKISPKHTFWGVLFLILSPAFIQAFTNLNSQAFFLFLLLAVFWLLNQNKPIIRYLAIIPLILASFIEVYSSILLVLVMMLYFRLKSEKNNLAVICLVTPIFIFVLDLFWRPIMHGPFKVQAWLPDLISDLGYISGLSFFILILSLMGLVLSWKKLWPQKRLRWIYPFGLITLVGYFYNTTYIFFLTVSATFFATLGFISLFENKWKIKELKKITYWLLILGIVFSTITFWERSNDYGPTLSDKNALSWIKDNTLSQSIIFSSPENGEYVAYFAQRKPFYSFSEKNPAKYALSQEILSSIYIQDLFPILEDQGINIIYINKNLRDRLPQDRGFLFLLKNERFKLVYSNEEAQVWSFK